MEMILTTTVKIISETSSLLPVKSDKPISTDKLKKAMKRVSKITVSAPVSVGDVIAKNFTEKGINLVSTKTVER